MRSTHCADCGEPLPPRKPGSGRPRRWCSEACRKKAHRRRHAVVVDWTAAGPVRLVPYVPPEGTIPTPPPREKVAPPEEQLAAAVLEAYTLAGLLRHLAHKVGRPQHAWRAEKLAEGLTELLEDLFPVK